METEIQKRIRDFKQKSFDRGAQDYPQHDEFISCMRSIANLHSRFLSKKDMWDFAETCEEDSTYFMKIEEFYSK